jgi:ABC-2 type transport system permease protein
MKAHTRGSLRRTQALIKKEFYQIIRDPSSILLSVVLPVILLFLYGFGISLDMKHMKIGLVLEETTPLAQSFAKALTDSMYFDVSIGRDRREFDKKIVDGSLKGMVVIPSYFSSFLGRPNQVAPIQVIADGADPNTATFVQNYVRGAFMNWLIQEKISQGSLKEPLLDVEPRFWYNEALESKNFLIPGSIAIIMTLIGTLLTALVIAKEWERGTMESLITTPVRMIELMIAKLISYFILGMCAFFISMVFSLVVFEVPFRSSVLLLSGVTTVFLWVALGLGLLISTLAKNQFVAAQTAIISAFLPAFMLSGFVYETSSMPWYIQYITYCIPAKYFVTCLQTLFLVGSVWKLLLYNTLMMSVIGLIFFVITARKIVKRLD